MDWLNDFILKFQDYPELKKLKETKFHGAITINFCEGVPQNMDYKLHRRATKIDGEYTDVRQGKTRYYKDGKLVGEQP